MRLRARARGMQRRTGEDFSVSQPAEINFTGMHHQAGSPLFSLLPLEIRTLIFADALAPYDDPSKPYAKDREYCRPGQRYHPRTDVALLQACKRIFQEARLVPVAQTTHTFWLFRGPWRSMRTGKCGMYSVPLPQMAAVAERAAACRRQARTHICPAIRFGGSGGRTERPVLLGFRRRPSPHHLDQCRLVVLGIAAGLVR